MEAFDILPLSQAALVSCFFVIGAVFGLVGNFTNFCTMGAVSDAVNFGDFNRARVWALAVLVAMIGTSALATAGLIDISKSIYTAPRLIWLSHIVGGLIFGVGMTLASGCSSRSLIRLGGGNLKGLIVLVFIAISAYMTLRGLFAVWRVNYLDAAVVQLGYSQTLPAWLSVSGGFTDLQALLAANIIMGLPLLGFILSNRRFCNVEHLLGGIVIGLCIVAAWYVSGHLGYTVEHPDTLEEAFVATNSNRMEALSFIGPMAYGLELLMLWSDQSRLLTVGIATLLGVVIGSAGYAIASGQFRLESFTRGDDMLRHILGGILMGFGGITALGCTIGQGISGLSTFAFGSILSSLAIVIGCACTMRYEYWKLTRTDN